MSSDLGGGDPAVEGGAISFPPDEMLANVVSDARVQHFIHYGLGPPSDIDRNEFHGVDLPVDRLTSQVIQLVNGTRRPAQELRVSTHLECRVLLEPLCESHLILADYHRLSHCLDGRGPGPPDPGLPFSHSLPHA